LNSEHFKKTVPKWGAPSICSTSILVTPGLTTARLIHPKDYSVIVWFPPGKGNYNTKPFSGEA